MVYKKYIKKRVNGVVKTFGPYYYESYRDESGNVKTRYVSETKKKKPIISSNKSFIFLSIIFALAILFLAGFISMNFQSQQLSLDSENVDSVSTGYIGKFYSFITGLVADDSVDSGSSDPTEAPVDDVSEEVVDLIEDSTEEEVIEAPTEQITEEVEEPTEEVIEETAEEPITEEPIEETPTDTPTEEESNETIVDEQAIEINITEEIVNDSSEILNSENVTEIVVAVQNETVSEETTAIEIINETQTEVSVNTSTRTRQYGAVLGKPVKWKKTVRVDVGIGGVIQNLSVELPKLAGNVSVKKIKSQGIEEELEIRTNPDKAIEEVEPNVVLIGGVFVNLFRSIFRTATSITARVVDILETTNEVVVEVEESMENNDEIEVEYYTDAPYAEEILNDNGKEITIIGPDEVHYENVLAFTYLETEIISKDHLTLNWITGNQSNIEFEAYDLDGNGAYDYIEWVVPHLSEQTYELLFQTSVGTGLVSFWSFNADGGSDASTAVDDRGLNNGTVNADINTSGKIEEAYTFDGSSNYISVPYDSSLNAGEGSFTFAAWIKPTGSFSSGRIGNTKGTGSSAGWQLAAYGDGSNWYIGNTYVCESVSDCQGFANSGNSYPENQWHHVAMVYIADDRFNIYINGVLDNSTIIGSYGSLSNALPLGIGAAVSSGSTPGVYAQYFKGEIDEVGFWNRALNATEIADLYGFANTSAPYITSLSLTSTDAETNNTNQNLTASVIAQDNDGDNITLAYSWYKDDVLNATTLITDGLVAYYPLNNDTLDYFGANDGVAQNFDGDEVVNGKVGGAYDFDNSDDFISIPTAGFDVSSGIISVCAWFNQTSGANGGIVSKWGLGGGHSDNTFLLNSVSTNHRFYISESDNTILWADSPAIVRDVWHHSCGMTNGTDILLYVDGSLIDTTPYDGTLRENGYPISVAKGRNNDYSTMYDGIIDEVMIFNRTLSAGEVKQLYEGSAYGGHTMNSSQTTAGDIWKLGVTGMDVLDIGNELNSSGLTVQAVANSVPLVSSVDLTSTDEDTNNTLQNLTASIVVSDEDGDNITLAYSWYKDDALNATTLITDGLVAYYPLNNDTYDYHGSNDGVNNGATLLEGQGKVGGAYSFDGNTDYIACGNGVDVIMDNQEFTSVAWIYPKKIINYMGITVKRDAYYVSLRNNRLAFYSYGLGLGDYMEGNTQIPLNQWTYVVTTWNGSDINMYLNGNLDKTTITTGSFTQANNNYNLTIGWDSSANPKFNGSIDEVQIYNRSLSASEIKQLYEGSKLGGHTLDSNLTTAGDVWKLGVTGMDVWDIGTETNSTPLEILSYAPNITSVEQFNITGDSGGSVTRGSNVTFNVTVSDIDEDVDSVWVKIWQGAIGVSSVIFQGFLDLIGSIWTIDVETNSSFNVGEQNYTIYANDSENNVVEQNASFNTSTQLTYIHDCSVLNTTGMTYILQNNITTNVSTCMDIHAPNIVLDLNGYAIEGDGSSYSNGITTINEFTINVTNVTIMNGFVNKFGACVYLFSFLGGSDYIVENITVDDCGQTGIGVSSNSIINNSFVNNCGTGGYSSSGINVVGTDVVVENVVINNSLSSGINFGGSNNIIRNVIIDDANSMCLSISSQKHYSNYFENVTMNDCTTVVSVGLLTGFTGTFYNSQILNTPLKANGGYQSSGVHYTFNFENEYGTINFSTIHDTFWGNQLDSPGDYSFGPGKNIQIANNSVYVNSSAIDDLNVSANVTLRGVDTSLLDQPTILKDNNPCFDCTNFTALTADTVIFRVTSWSNYTIGDGAPGILSVDLTSTNSTTNNTFQNLTSSVSAFDAQGDNITLAYNWYKDDALNATTLITEGLVSYWPLNNDTSDYYGDNDGVNNGATLLEGQGKVGGAYSFDGSSYVDMGDVSPLDMGLNDITISAWIKTSSGPGAIYDKSRDGGGFTQGYIFIVNTPGRLHVAMGDTSTQRYSNDGDIVNDGKWHHVVAVFDRDDVMTKYIDGNITGTTTDISTYSSDDIDYGNHAMIGARYNNGLNDIKMDGKIDEVMIFNRSLSAEEVQQIYEGSKLGGHALDSNLTTAGDTWKLGVTGMDFLNIGNEVNSSGLTIVDYNVNITQVEQFNITGDSGGTVRRGDNVTINVTVSDIDGEISNVWIKIWQGAIGVSSVIFQGFLDLIGSIWTINVETNTSFNVGEVNYTIYANDSEGTEVSQNASFDIIHLVPNSTEFMGTNFSVQEDLTAVENLNLTLAGNATIIWNNNVSVEGQDFDINIEFGQGFVSINSSALDFSINSSANVTLFNVNCLSKIYEADGFYTTLGDILGNGTECTSCSNIQCSGGTLTFTTEHFSGFAAGGGTPEDPYEISNCSELNMTRDNLTASYELVNDINCSETINWDSGQGFDPIGNVTNNYQFTGTFYGNNYTISELYINRPSSNYVGLFGYIGKNLCTKGINCGEIKNLGLKHINITGQAYMGGLAGISYGYIDKVYTSGEVHAKGALFWTAVGGLVGQMQFGALINNSYSDVKLEGGVVDEVGGLVGRLTSNLTNSYFSGSVTGGDQVGGLVGYSLSGSTINNSFSTANVSGSTGVGSLIGIKAGGTILENSYWNNQTGNPSQCYSGGDVGCTAIQDDEAYFKGNVYPNRAPMSGWAFFNVWEENETDYPKLTWQDLGGNLIYAPNVTSVDLTSTDPATNDTLQNLTGTVAASDADGDNVTLKYSWYKDDALNATTLITDGLVGYWPLNNDTNDYYGDNDGVNNGAVQNKTSYAVGGSYTFDGTDYINISNNPSLEPADEITFCLWAKFEGNGSFDDGSVPLSKGISNGAPRWASYGIVYYPDINKISILVSTNDAPHNHTYSVNNYYLNELVHICGNYNGVQSSIYVNGLFENSTSASGPINYSMDYTGNLFLGAHMHTLANRTVDGSLDEVMIFNRSLSAEEIKQLYEGSKLGGHTLDSNQTTAGDIWKLGVTGMDVLGIGDEVNSSGLTILNANPNITNVEQFNITGDSGGEVIRGQNVTINVTVTDIDGSDDIDSVWIKIWQGAIGISSVIFEGFLELVAGIWTIDVETNQSFNAGEVNYTIYANDSENNIVEQNASFNASEDIIGVCPVRMIGMGNSTIPCMVTNCTQLQAINQSLGLDYALANDIDCSDTINWNSGVGFNPIGRSTNRFTGSLNGRNHTINDLFINVTYSFSGLFGALNGAVIRNLGLENINYYTNQQHMGGISSLLENSIIEQVYVTGSIIDNDYSSGSFLGGIGSYDVSNATIRDCWTNVNITGDSHVIGGIVGSFYNSISSITNCYSVGGILSSSTSTVGGLIGNANGGGYVNNSFATNSIYIGASYPGGICAQQCNVAKFVNCGWYDVSGDDAIWAISNYGPANVTYNLNNEAYFKGNVYPVKGPMSSWDFYNTWEEVEGDYPHLTWENLGGEVNNSAPNVTSVDLTSTDPTTNNTLQNLTGTVSVTDVDGDNVTLKYSWYKDDVLNATTLITDGLVSYWPLNNDTNDYYGDNDGVNNGAILNASGKVGGAYDFDGVDDMINVPDLNINTNFTFSAWMYPRTAGEVSGRLIGGTVGNFIIGIIEPNNFIWFNNVGAKSNNNVFEYNEWSHVVVTRNSTNSIKFYINGLEEGTAISSGIDTGNYYIGNDPSGNRTFNGSIDEVMIFNRSLSAEEIKQLYEGSKLGGHTLDSNLTTAGDEWILGVTGMDVLGIGDEVNSSGLTILNANPNITNVEQFNITGDSGGEVIRGQNVTINVTVTDIDGSDDIDSVWIKIWQGAIGISSVIFEGFLELVAGIWTIDVETNSSFNIGAQNYTIYANDSEGIEVSQNESFTITSDLPVLTGLAITSTDSTTNYTTENLIASWSVSDPNGDSVKNITNWFVDGQSITVLNMPFEQHNASGSGLKDYSPYSNNGTNNGATWNATGGYDGNGAYEFDGVDGRIILNNLNVGGEGNSFSYSFWYKTDDFSGTTQKTILRESLNSKFVIYINPVKENISVTYYSSGWQSTLEANSILGEFAHISINYDALINNFSLYQNSNLVSTSITSQDPEILTSTNLGYWPNAYPDQYVAFNGTIDDLQIFNRSLSAEQVAALYNNRSDLIVSQETTKGENWSVEVTPNDGYNDGITVMSDNLTILNKAPNVTNVDLTSTDANINDTLQNLTGSVTVSDVDSDNITLAYSWYKDDVLNTTTLITDGLVAYYPLDNDVRDYHGDNDGVNNGAVLNYSGKVGGTYDFDGTNYIKKLSPLGFPSGTEAYTMSSWVYIKNNTGTASIILARPTGTGTFTAMSMAYEPAYNAFGSHFDTCGVFANMSVSFNRWYYLAITKSSGSSSLLTKIYVNGVEQAIRGDSTDCSVNINPQKFEIGAGWWNGDAAFPFNGSIDEVMIFNRSLSAEEVQQIYEGSKLGGHALDSNLTTAGDTWKLGVTGMDVLDIGNELNSSGLTILGTEPSIDTVEQFNITGDSGGEVIRGDNLTINLTVSDIDEDVDSVWVKIWQGAIGVSSILYQGFLDLIVGVWTIDIETNASFNVGEVNYTIYANDSENNVVEQNASFNTSTQLTYITRCGILDDEGMTYELQNDITNHIGTCFRIDADNIVLNGNGHTIDGDGDLSGDHGIYTETPSGINNITIKNFYNISEFANGISLGWTDNSLVQNNTISSNTYGIQVVAFSDNNHFIDNVITSNTAVGFYLQQSSGNTIVNLQSFGNGNAELGVFLPGPGNNLIYNNSFGEINFYNLSFGIEGNLGLNNNLIIGNNSAYLNSNSELSELNKSANITLRGVDTSGFNNPSILKDGVICSDCYNFTPLTGAVIVFNVSSWSNYSIGSGNLAPNTTLVIINSTLGKNFTNENLSCYARGVDDINTSLISYYRWYNGTSLFLSGQKNGIVNGSLTLISTLGSGNTSTGENWTCSIIFGDGTNNETDWNNKTLNVIAGCGDRIKNLAEVCDGSDFGGLSCGTYGYTTGGLVCTASCTNIDIGDCENPSTGCTPSCPSASSVSCGSPLGSDGCGGTCSGTGTLCSAGESCVSGSCVPESECNINSDCSDDGNVCTNEVCSGGTCTHPYNTNSCDDGDLCTTDDVCSAGTCGGVVKDCNDDRACTVDSCNVLGVCVNDASACACSSDSDCEDDNDCIDYTCNVLSGTCSTPIFNTNSCDDGDATTINDVCTEGVCVGELLNCDDGDPCTIDTIVGGSCDNTFDNGACSCVDDSDCGNTNPCKDVSCVLGNCIYENNDNSCDDNDACTNHDECSNGVCRGEDIESEECSDLIDDSEIPEDNVLLDSIDCNPNFGCGKWGECQGDYSVEDLIFGDKVLGTRTRLCKDFNECQSNFIETEECSFKVEVIVEKIQWCNEAYLEVRDSEGNVLARLKEGNNKNYLDIDLNLVGKGYCGYCYDNIQNYDEEGVDCGGSCLSCDLELESPKQIQNSFMTFVFTSLIFIGLFVTLVIYLIKNLVISIKKEELDYMFRKYQSWKKKGFEVNILDHHIENLKKED